MLCSLLYVGFSHFGPACVELTQKIKTPEATFVFLVTCMVSERARSAQACIEGDGLQKDPLHQLGVRFLGLFLIVVQTLALASAVKPFASARWHLAWPARYLLGSYLLNLNFLDVFGISPAVRRRGFLHPCVHEWPTFFRPCEAHLARDCFGEHWPIDACALAAAFTAA